MSKKIYQFSGVNALMGGVFDGLFSIQEIQQHGDFGLGCSNGLKGELIIESCHFLEAKGHQGLRTMTQDERLPFAQITTFNADNVLNVDNVNKTNLYDHLVKHTLLDNVFLAVRIDGVFEKIKIRRPNDSGKNYHSALDVAEDQIVDELTDISGSLIGFWTPKFFQNISVAGFHLHFIDTQRHIGGHVMDFSIQKATLSYEVKSTINIELSEDNAYLKHDLNIDNMKDIIEKVEN